MSVKQSKAQENKISGKDMSLDFHEGWRFFLKNDREQNDLTDIGRSLINYLKLNFLISYWSLITCFFMPPTHLFSRMFVFLKNVD